MMGQAVGLIIETCEVVGMTTLHDSLLWNLNEDKTRLLLNEDKMGQSSMNQYMK